MFKVKDEWASGNFTLQPSDEDIHTANERRLKVHFLFTFTTIYRNIKKHFNKANKIYALYTYYM